MLNIGAGEMVLIAVVALLVLGPERLPQLARGLGKFVRAFRRQTEEVRSVVEREFYRMDEDVQTPVVPKLPASERTVARGLPAPAPTPVSTLGAPAVDPEPHTMPSLHAPLDPSLAATQQLQTVAPRELEAVKVATAAADDAEEGKAKAG